MKKTKAYPLSSFSSQQIYLFQRRITDAMREGILEILDEDTFVSKALELVKTNGKAKDQTSKAREVLTHFLGKGNYTDYKELFLEKILGIREIPYKGARRIEAVVKQDLKELNELISHYQHHDYIKKLIEKDESPRNHEEKILHDFYKRCLREREIILDYLLNGIGQRAIASMFVLEGALMKIADYGRSLRERPYQFWNFFKEGYFDYRKIDDFWHRVRVFPMPDEKGAFKLYKKDKARFYLKFFKRHPAADIFVYILKYLSQLPINEGRSPVF